MNATGLQVVRLSFYVKVVRYLLATYAKNKILAQALKDLEL